jgi:hypothetical protein
MAGEADEELEREWEPGQDLYFHFEDKTHEPREAGWVGQMVEAVQEAVNAHDFDVEAYGLLLPMADHLNRRVEIERAEQGILEVSSYWTRGERFRLARLLSARLQAYFAQAGPGWNRHTIIDLSQRIHAVLHETSEYLEAHRPEILREL